jgi:hypothetical protein
MASYEQISKWVRASSGRTPKTCHIAHVKADFGLTQGIAPNRQNAASRVHPCPDYLRPHIEAALRHFGMI